MLDGKQVSYPLKESMPWPTLGGSIHRQYQKKKLSYPCIHPTLFRASTERIDIPVESELLLGRARLLEPRNMTPTVLPYRPPR